MNKKLINSQIFNYNTYQMYLRQMLSLAQNVFTIKNLPKFIDESFLNKKLLYSVSIAFFVDEVMGLLCLPYINLSSLDVYGRPVKIQVIGQNGYTRKLNRNEFVIMYDNEARYPLYLDILQYAERMANCVRTTDINISQQKTPRIWKTTQEKVQTLKDMINNVEGNQEIILALDDFFTQDVQAVLEPAPYVTDKIDIHKNEIWNEFLRLIGVSNISYQKKERQIKDEIIAMQGGTIAERSNRFNPRKKAIEEINEKFGDYLDEPLEVEFYDGLPTTLEETNKTGDVEENYFDEGGIDDV